MRESTTTGSATEQRSARTVSCTCLVYAFPTDETPFQSNDPVFLATTVQYCHTVSTSILIWYIHRGASYPPQPMTGWRLSTVRTKELSATEQWLRSSSRPIINDKCGRSQHHDVFLFFPTCQRNVKEGPPYASRLGSGCAPPVHAPVTSHHAITESNKKKLEHTDTCNKYRALMLILSLSPFVFSCFSCLTHHLGSYLSDAVRDPGIGSTVSEPLPKYDKHLVILAQPDKK